jgi:hypothetical protein
MNTIIRKLYKFTKIFVRIVGSIWKLPAVAGCAEAAVIHHADDHVIAVNITVF